MLFNLCLYSLIESKQSIGKGLGMSSEKDQKKNKNSTKTETMPLRDSKHEVELVTMPDETHPVLGSTKKPDEVDVRISSQLEWEGTARSPRSESSSESAAVKSELDLRSRTALSYQVSPSVRAKINRMHTKQENVGRKATEKDSERVTVRIGPDPIV